MLFGARCPIQSSACRARVLRFSRSTTANEREVQAPTRDSNYLTTSLSSGVRGFATSSPATGPSVAKKIEGAKISTFKSEGRNAAGAPRRHPSLFRYLCRFIRSGTDSAPRHSGITRDVRSRREASRSWKRRARESPSNPRMFPRTAAGRSFPTPTKPRLQLEFGRRPRRRCRRARPGTSGISARSATQYSRDHQCESCIKRLFTFGRGRFCPVRFVKSN